MHGETVKKRTALFCGIAQEIVVIPYRSFRTTYLVS
jgi:hypothetical protein